MKISNVLFEFEDLNWFPNTIRESMMDCLRFIITHSKLYQPVIPLINEGLKNTGSKKVIDLCSGGGGAIEQLQKGLHTENKNPVSIILTDKFPNQHAFELIANASGGTIKYSESSVDAVDVPKDLKGFRTIFTAIHHFDKSFIKSIIKNAVDAKSGIGIFDGGDKNLFIIIGLILIHPVIFFFCTPFFKPFRLSRIVFTYLIPVIPLCQIWDGVVSIIRLYQPDELLKIAQEVEPNGYSWKAGKIKNRFGFKVSYLLGYPYSSGSK